MTEKPGDLLIALPELVRAELERRGLSQREAAKELRLSPSTITRVVQGRAPDAHGLLVILRWLGLSAEWLREPDDAHAAYRRGWDDCAVRVRAALVPPTVDGQL